LKVCEVTVVHCAPARLYSIDQLLNAQAMSFVTKGRSQPSL
jgi:hypothetical protein